VPYRLPDAASKVRRSVADLRTAISIAFAWGPAIDLAVEILWTVRGSAQAAGRIGLALAGVIARYAIARFAFRASTPFCTAIRLATPTLLLGVALRLAWLWPVLGGAIEGGRAGVVLSNLLFHPVVIALYASLLPALLHGVGQPPRDDGRAMAAAALWVALAQATCSYFGFWDTADEQLCFVGLDWTARVALGVAVPLIVAGGAVFYTATKGAQLSRVYSALIAWMVVPATVFCARFASGVFGVIDPLIVAAARAPDGTQLILIETYNDPYDVMLEIGRPGESWTRLPLVRNDSLWSGRIDVAAQGTTATISAFDVVAATVDWQSGAVTKIAPMTWFKLDVSRWRSVPDPLCSSVEERPR
jgi:hypothetical protein